VRCRDSASRVHRCSLRSYVCLYRCTWCCKGGSGLDASGSRSKLRNFVGLISFSPSSLTKLILLIRKYRHEVLLLVCTSGIPLEFPRADYETLSPPILRNSDDIEGDQRLAHNSGEDVSIETLKALGVLPYPSIDIAQVESMSVFLFALIAQSYRSVADSRPIRIVPVQRRGTTRTETRSM
jgi:hypothetical protein